MTERPSVLVISQGTTLTALHAALKGERFTTEVAATIPDAEWFLRDHPDAVCVIDGDLPLDLAFQAYELVHASEKRSAVILTTPETTPFFGAGDGSQTHEECIPKAAGVEQIVLRVKALLILAGFDVSIAQNAQREMPQVPPVSQRGKITVVFSAKGGVGKTTLAVNAGVALARRGQPTLLVDANLYFGDASVLINVASRRSLLDLADIYQVDAASVHQLMVQHESGLSLLSSPAQVERVETLSTEIVIAAIAASATSFDHVIIDTHSSFDETNLQLLELADSIVLVTTPEVGATYNTGLLGLAETLGYRDKVLLVLNRSETGIKTEAVESNLGQRVTATIVSAGRRAVSAANRGVPLVTEDPRQDQRITRDLEHVADLISGDAPIPARAREPRKWLFGRKLALSSARSA